MQDRRVFAAIDIGTVTCRLLVAEVTDSGLNELARECAITNLGIGVDALGYLAEDAIKRVSTQVDAYVQEIERIAGDVPVFAVATSAARDAKNSDELIASLRTAGVELAIIPGKREAALSFLGASSGHRGEHLLVVDIGGGSTEVVFGIGGSAPVFAHSFNIGCRRMTERFFIEDPPSQAHCDALRSYVRSEFAPVFAQAYESGTSVERIVAVAGTATSVVSIDQGMEVYDSARVHGSVVSLDTLVGVYDRLRFLPLEKRKCVVGLEPKRAGVIVAGMAILLEVLKAAGMSGFTVSESDILQGLIMDGARRA